MTIRSALRRGGRSWPPRPLIVLGACSTAAGDDAALDSLSRLPHRRDHDGGLRRPSPLRSKRRSSARPTPSWRRPASAPFSPPPATCPRARPCRRSSSTGELRSGSTRPRRASPTGTRRPATSRASRWSWPTRSPSESSGLSTRVILDIVPVDPDKKTDVVQDGIVDLTVSAVTMTCGRWEEVAFSTEYYTATQQFLVRKGSSIETAADLAEKPVCVIANSTSSRSWRSTSPRPSSTRWTRPHRVPSALQEGEVDAYFGHDSFLYGMVATDPTVEVKADLLPGVDTQSNYGIAIAKDRLDLVRFVNAVLEDLRTNGTWAELHKTSWKSRSASPMPSRRSRVPGLTWTGPTSTRRSSACARRPIGPARTCSSSTSRPAVPCSPRPGSRAERGRWAGGRRGAGRPLPVVRRCPPWSRRPSPPAAPARRSRDRDEPSWSSSCSGPSVELPERAVPIGERDLLSGSRTIRRCTPDQLLASMTQPFAVARTVIVAAGEAWEVGGPLLQSLREQLTALAECGEHGIVEDDLAVAEQRLEKLEETLVGDPSPSMPHRRRPSGPMSASWWPPPAARDGPGTTSPARWHRPGRACGAATRGRRRPAAVPRGPSADRRCATARLDPPGDVRRPARPDRDLAAAGAWATVHVELADWHRRLEIEQQQIEVHRTAELQDLVERRRRLRAGWTPTRPRPPLLAASRTSPRTAPA